MNLRAAFQDRRVLITGGLGFLGSNLAHRLVGLGARVQLVDSLDPRYGGNRHNLQGIESAVDVAVADVRTCLEHPDWVEAADYVFNLAGQGSHLDSVEDPWSDFQANCQTHLAVLEACRIYQPRAKLVYAGTRGQYGRPQYLPVDEAHPCAPIDPYGLHKHLGEAYHLFYARHHGLRVTSLRLANLYGPRQAMRTGRQGFLNWFLRLAMDGEEIPVFGDGQQRRDFLYVDDAVEALLLGAAHPSADGHIFNVGSGVPHRIDELAAVVCAVAGAGARRRVPYPPEAACLEIGDYCANIRKLQNHLGWAPRTSLEDGLRQTMVFYAQHREHYWTPSLAASVAA